MKLTQQQTRILELLAAGESKKMIASELKCSRDNIEHIIRRVRKKVNCSNVTHLVAFCLTHGYITMSAKKGTDGMEGE
jgi:DNA-binding NarL/FixJ family response regulator